MLTTQTKIDVYEIDGDEQKARDQQACVFVENHWNVGSFVVLVVDGKRLTVKASDLLRAVNNAVDM